MWQANSNTSGKLDHQEQTWSVFKKTPPPHIAFPHSSDNPPCPCAPPHIPKFQHAPTRTTYFGFSVPLILFFVFMFYEKYYSKSNRGLELERSTPRIKVESSVSCGNKSSHYGLRNTALFFPYVFSIHDLLSFPSPFLLLLCLR